MAQVIRTKLEDKLTTKPVKPASAMLIKKSETKLTLNKQRPGLQSLLSMYVFFFFFDTVSLASICTCVKSEVLVSLLPAASCRLFIEGSGVARLCCLSMQADHSLSLVLKKKNLGWETLQTSSSKTASSL